MKAVREYVCGCGDHLSDEALAQLDAFEAKVRELVGRADRFVRAHNDYKDTVVEDTFGHNGVARLQQAEHDLEEALSAVEEMMSE